MILPTKHIRFSESLLGIGGVLINLIDSPKTVDELWNRIQKEKKWKFISKISFDDLLMTLGYLYLIGLVELDKNGKIINAIN